MKRILLLLTLGFFVNVALAQSTNTTKEEAKTEKKCTSAEKSACAKKCARSKKSCSKSSEKTDTSKCSKVEACCSKTGKKRADCDKKDKGCCA